MFIPCLSAPFSHPLKGEFVGLRYLYTEKYQPNESQSVP